MSGISGLISSFFITGVLMSTGPFAHADETYTFSLLPVDGNVSGVPGSTVGWGYSITNNSTSDWLVTTDLNADPFLDGTPNLIFDFPDLAPLTTVSLPFDETSDSGIYEFTWDPTAPDGFANFGSFTVSAEWWDGDPLNGGQFISTSADVSAPYNASVAQSASTPEPSTFAPMLVLGLCGLFTALRRRSLVVHKFN